MDDHREGNRPGFLMRIGLWPAVMVITSASILASMALTSVAAKVLHFGNGDLVTILAVSALVPLPIAASVAVLLMRLVRSLDLARRQVHQLAVTDGLTGVCNRRHFMELAEAEFIKARRYGLVVSLLMVDADHFKNVNDQYGHDSGDKVLQALSRAASSSVRAVDVVARYGGEEFVVLLPLTAAADALQVAERMRASIEALQISIDGGSTLSVTVSVGCATCEAAACSLRSLLSQADKALYRAKASGRNQVAFDPVT